MNNNIHTTHVGSYIEIDLFVTVLLPLPFIKTDMKGDERRRNPVWVGDQALLPSMEMALFRAPLALSRLRNQRADCKVRDLPFACPIPALHPLPESAILHSVRGHSILSLLGEMRAALLQPLLKSSGSPLFQAILSLGYLMP